MDSKPLSPSERKRLTEPQINKLKDAFSAALHKVNPFSDEAQELIETSWDEVRDEVEAANVDALNRVLDRKRNTITIRVRVKRGRKGRQVFADTGRVQYVDGDVAATAPLVPGDGYEGVDFVFFKVGSRISDAQVELERQKRGLVRDLEAQAQANADRPEFADTHPNGDSWQDKDGNWCFAHFNRDFDDGERCVYIDQSGGDWYDDDWLGGVARKLPSAA